MQIEQVKFYDAVFSANKRQNNEAVEKLAKWLTVEYLEKLNSK